MRSKTLKAVILLSAFGGATVADAQYVVCRATINNTDIINSEILEIPAGKDWIWVGKQWDAYIAKKYPGAEVSMSMCPEGSKAQWESFQPGSLADFKRQYGRDIEISNWRPSTAAPESANSKGSKGGAVSGSTGGSSTSGSPSHQEALRTKCARENTGKDGTLSIVNNCQDRINISWCYHRPGARDDQVFVCKPQPSTLSSTGFFYDRTMTPGDIQRGGKFNLIPAMDLPNTVFWGACAAPYVPHIVSFSTATISAHSKYAVACTD